MAHFPSAALAVLLCAGSPRAAAPAVTIDSLLAQFRAVPGLSAHFREEKRLALLSVPLFSEGTVHFAPPGRLARHTTAPSASTLLIDGDRLSFGDGAQSETIPLDANPVVRLFVDGFMKLLAGDKAALLRIFTIDLRPHAAGWELRLLPKVAPMTEVLRSIVIHGKGVVLSKMTIAETTGDETVTTFDQVDVDRRYRPAEIARLFALPRGK